MMKSGEKLERKYCSEEIKQAAGVYIEINLLNWGQEASGVLKKWHSHRCLYCDCKEALETPLNLTSYQFPLTFPGLIPALPHLPVCLIWGMQLQGQ